MATHSSTLAWKIPWMEEPGRLQSMGSHRVGHDWSDLAAAANQVKRSVQLPPVGAAILMLPDFCTTCHSGMSLRPAYAGAIFHSNCLNFIDTLLILAYFPNRASSYLLIQKLSSDNRWLQYGPSSSTHDIQWAKFPRWILYITFYF